MTVAERVQGIIDELVEAAEMGACCFWACDGPNADPVPMKTCRICWAISDLRGAIAKPTETSTESSDYGFTIGQF